MKFDPSGVWLFLQKIVTIMDNYTTNVQQYFLIRHIFKT